MILTRLAVVLQGSKHIELKYTKQKKIGEDARDEKTYLESKKKNL